MRPKTLNIHTIAIQVPIKDLTAGRSVPTDADELERGARRVERRRAGARCGSPALTTAERRESGPWVQVSRLGNPLFNEVVMPMGDKDRWNAPIRSRTKRSPSTSSSGAGQAAARPVSEGVPEPGRVHQAACRSGGDSAHRDPQRGRCPGFQNFTGSVQADQLRLNVAIPPTTSKPSTFGLLGDDLAGFPNGRRVFDDVVSIELRAIAGATYPARRHELHGGRGGRRARPRA